MSDSESEESNKLYYVHLKNLPWSACHQDVHQFFDGIPIPPGGVSIYYKDAFIIFTSKNDSEKALARSGKDIHGKIVHLASSVKREVFKRKCQYISRKLEFSPTLRRIRPTIVPKKSKDMFNVFNPIETVCGSNYEILTLQPSKGKSKKIRPTLVKDLKELQVFEKSEAGFGGHCNKKLRLADNWLVSHIENI